MREISVALNVSVEDTFDMFPPSFRVLVEEVRRQKLAGERRMPSAVLIDRSSLFTSSVRGKLIDAVAALVDENCTGRGDMCLQFAALLNKAFEYLQFPVCTLCWERQSIMTPREERFFDRSTHGCASGMRSSTAMSIPHVRTLACPVLFPLPHTGGRSRTHLRTVI